MPTFNTLYSDKRFSGVSAQTKTDIINTIGVDVNEAKDDVAESKFTQDELKDALHYLLAKAAKQNPAVQDIFLRDNNYNDSYLGDPFYFPDNDPLLFYLLAANLDSSHHHHSSSGNRGGDMNCSNEGAGIVVAVACVCAAGVCCGLCMLKTLDGPESDIVKGAKMTTSSVVGLLTFILLTYYLLSNDVGRTYLVDERDWDVAGYRFFMVLMSAFGAFLASGTVSSINNLLTCPPSDDLPEPSARVLEALKDLQVIETLLAKGWSRDGDDVDQCNELIREVIKIYIGMLAAPDHRARLQSINASTSVPVASAPPLSQVISRIGILGRREDYTELSEVKTSLSNNDHQFSGNYYQN